MLRHWKHALAHTTTYRIAAPTRRKRPTLSAICGSLVLLLSVVLGGLSACGANTAGGPDGPYLHEVVKSASTRQHKPYAILLCKASDVADEPHTIAYYKQLFLKDSRGTGNIYDYWLNMSYGSIDLDGSLVAGWYTMATTKAQLDARNNAVAVTRVQTLVDCKNAAIKAAGSGWSADTLSHYAGIIAVINIVTDSGQATSNTVVIDPVSPPVFIEHEMGHALGLNHSMVMARDSGAVHTWSPGGDGEYSDCWDIMSAFSCVLRYKDPIHGASGPELEAAYRDQLGWMPDGRVYTYSGTTRQVVPLAPVNEPRTAGYLLAKVPVGTLGYYTVEFRRKSGWDQGIPHDAVLIHELRASTLKGEESSIRTFVVSRSNFSTWLPGQVFQDTANKVRITIDAFGGGTASVSISRDVSTTPDATSGGGINCDRVTGGMPKSNPFDGMDGTPIVSGCAPIVTVTTPTTVPVLATGSPTTLSADVVNPVGDTLPDANVVWTEYETATGTVTLGTGRTLKPPTPFPAGLYRLTATATNSLGQSTSASVVLTVCDYKLCTPHVTINQPADGTHVRAGVPFSLAGYINDPGYEGRMTDANIVWTANDVSLGNGANLTTTLTAPGTYTIALTATTPVLGYKGTATITLIVDPPSVTPFVSITEPLDGQWYYDVTSTGQSVTLTGSGNVSQYVWTDAINGGAATVLGSGPMLSVTLHTVSTANCALTTHLLTLTGTAADGSTATEHVTVTLRATCIR